MKRKTVLALMVGAVLGSMAVSGCTSSAKEQQAQSVITALPTEVMGCTFVGNVDAPPRMTIETARFDLKVKASELGATHLVETYSYARQMNSLAPEVGVALSGRAYICPEGLGPKVNNPNGRLKMPDFMPQPTLNDDDPHFFL